MKNYLLKRAEVAWMNGMDSALISILPKRKLISLSSLATKSSKYPIIDLIATKCKVSPYFAVDLTEDQFLDGMFWEETPYLINYRTTASLSFHFHLSWR